MILQKMELTLGVEWLDPENVDKKKRKAMVAERLLKMFSHEFAEATTDQHGIKIEIVGIDGVRIKEKRELKEPSEVSSSGNNR